MTSEKHFLFVKQATDFIQSCFYESRRDRFAPQDLVEKFEMTMNDALLTMMALERVGLVRAHTIYVSRTRETLWQGHPMNAPKQALVPTKNPHWFKSEAFDGHVFLILLSYEITREYREVLHMKAPTTCH